MEELLLSLCVNEQEKEVVNAFIATRNKKLASGSLDMSYSWYRKIFTNIISRSEEDLSGRLSDYGSKRSWTDKDLEAAVKSSYTWSDVISKLGLSTTSAGNWRLVRKYSDKLGIDYSHFTGRRSGKGGNVKRPLSEILQENTEYHSSHLRKRLIDEGYKEAKCENCGLTEWMGKPIPLELEHVSGNNKDNRIENLEILCLNCHGLTLTWRRKKSSLTA